MNYPEFRDAVFRHLQEILPDDVSIRLLEVEKLNSSLRHGILFTKENTFFSPTIYLESFYEAYSKGQDVFTLAQELLTCYEEEIVEPPLSVYHLTDFEFAKENLFVKLIHLKENENMLKDIPYLTYLDFAIIPYYEIDEIEMFQGTVLIHKKFLENWQITKDELLTWAIQNTKDKKQVYFVNIVELLDARLTNDEKYIFEQTSNLMYVLTNDKKHLGAILAYYPDVLQMIQNVFGEDYYLLPASIHEWIVLPVSSVDDEDYLRYMVTQVNRTELLPEEVLSDNVYLYNSKSQTIQFC